MILTNFLDVKRLAGQITQLHSFEGEEIGHCDNSRGRHMHSRWDWTTRLVSRCGDGQFLVVNQRDYD
jgi:hypothetical protein